MIDWMTVRVTEPPVTMSISDDDLREFIYGNELRQSSHPTDTHATHRPWRGASRW